MAGETVKTRAICLRIHPWSRTSHVVRWLTPAGRVSTVVKGAVRPKSQFLGQYDLNYTCDIIYYLRAGRGDLHALRECAPFDMRDALRGDLGSLMAADHLRALAGELAPVGEEAAEWYALLEGALDRLAGAEGVQKLAEVVAFELAALRLSGLEPEIEARDGSFALRGERRIPVSAAVARCMAAPLAEKNLQILLDAARVIGVFYTFHLDCPLDGRRSVIKAISQQNEERQA